MPVKSFETDNLNCEIAELSLLDVLEAIPTIHL